MWARGVDRVCSSAWLTVHLGFYLITGTALILLNALTAPRDLWFGRPMVVLGALLSVHGVATLVRTKATWFKPAGALGRSAWSHLKTIRQVLLAPAVSGIVAMPDLFSVRRPKSALTLGPTASRSGRGPAITLTDQASGSMTAAPPSGWASPMGSSHAAPAEAGLAQSEPVPAVPARPAYATWPTPPVAAVAPAAASSWPPLTVKATASPAPAHPWPAAPSSQASPANLAPAWPAGPVPVTDSFWLQPARPPSPGWSQTWPASDLAAPRANSAPPRLIEQDAVLIGNRRTDPEYAPWDQLEAAASTWLAHRASSPDAAEASS